MLPSQTARPSNTRTAHVNFRARRKRWPLMIGGAGSLVLAFALFSLLGSDEPSPASAMTEASNEIASLASNPTPPAAAPTTVAPASEPTVPKVSMGAPLAKPDAAASNQPATSTASASNAPHGPMSGPDLSNPKPAPVPASAPMPAPQSPPQLSADSNHLALQRAKAGFDLLAQNQPVEARRMLTAALHTQGLSPVDAERIRTELTRLNDRLVFSPMAAPGDPYCRTYVIESADRLSKLPRKLGLHVDWRFIQRINNISAPERIQLGQRLKVVTGPFHAVVDKRNYRMDLYMGDDDERVFVRSFPVGLGEFNATPEGAFVVKKNSKLINPEWVNPRTGQKFAANDPENPIGEHWIGLVGASDTIRGLEGYGIHGTIDPESIGQQRSMGCVRMHAQDVALVYELLIDEVSVVEIVGDEYP